MDNAKILLAEDNEMERYYVKKALRGSGHEVVREAEDLQTTIDALEDIRDGNLDCDVLILDGNLSRDSRQCADAKIVTELARAYNLGLRIVGFSTYSMTSLGIPVDIDPGKGQLDSLAAVLDTL